MAISDEITRLQSAKSALKTSIEGKGVTVPSSAKLEDYPALVDSIEAGGGDDDDNWYAVCTHNRQPLTYWFVKETSEKWSMPNPYSTNINFAEDLYFLYKGEKYYTTGIEDGNNSLLSKNGGPVRVYLSQLNIARIVKQNGNYYVYFETD